MSRMDLDRALFRVIGREEYLLHTQWLLLHQIFTHGHAWREVNSGFYRIMGVRYLAINAMLLIDLWTVANSMDSDSPIVNIQKVVFLKGRNKNDATKCHSSTAKLALPEGKASRGYEHYDD